MRTQVPRKYSNADFPPDAIIRYPNRRLYSLAISNYITFDDIGRMIEQGRGFEIKVFDKKTRAEITDQVLAAYLGQLVHQEKLSISREVLLGLFGVKKAA